MSKLHKFIIIKNNVDTCYLLLLIRNRLFVLLKAHKPISKGKGHSQIIKIFDVLLTRPWSDH
jgi:hypothetical protein